MLHLTDVFASVFTNADVGRSETFSRALMEASSQPYQTADGHRIILPSKTAHVTHLNESGGIFCNWLTGIILKIELFVHAFPELCMFLPL